MSDMSEAEQVRVLLAYVNGGMQILAVRVLLVLALVMSFGLFCWTMYYPTPERIGAAALFAGMVFFPILRLDQRTTPQRKEITP